MAIDYTFTSSLEKSPVKLKSALRIFPHSSSISELNQKTLHGTWVFVFELSHHRLQNS